MAGSPSSEALQSQWTKLSGRSTRLSGAGSGRRARDRRDDQCSRARSVWHAVARSPPRAAPGAGRRRACRPAASPAADRTTGPPAPAERAPRRASIRETGSPPRSAVGGNRSPRRPRRQRARSPSATRRCEAGNRPRLDQGGGRAACRQMVLGFARGAVGTRRPSPATRLRRYSRLRTVQQIRTRFHPVFLAAGRYDRYEPATLRGPPRSPQFAASAESAGSAGRRLLEGVAGPAIGLEGRDLGHPAGMTATLEGGLQPGLDDLFLHLGAEHPG